MSGFIYIPEDGSGSGVNGYIFASLPTITDDITKGFDINDLAMYDGSVYVCVDNTTGAAIWKKTTTQGANGNKYLVDSSENFIVPIGIENITTYMQIDGILTIDGIVTIIS